MGKRDKHPADRPPLRGPEQADYEVGYAKPPKHTRFKSGQSGNPRGRPKGAKNKRPALNEERLKSIIVEEAYRSIKVNDGDRPVTVPMAQAIVRSLAVNAARGNPRAQRLFTELLSSTERDNKQLYDEWLETAIQYKVDWERELEHRKLTGKTGREPLPHPDDVIIDMRTGQVQIKGPMTKEEKVLWDRARERKAECDREIAEIKRTLRNNPEHKHKKLLLKDMEHERELREIITRMLPD